MSFDSFQQAPAGTTFGFQPGFQAISLVPAGVVDAVAFGPPRSPLAEMLVAQSAKLAREDAERDAAIAAIRSRMAPSAEPEEAWLLGLISDEEWMAA